MAQAVTFRTEADMVAAVSKLPLGALAFVLLPAESLYLRIQAGYREIQVDHAFLCRISSLKQIKSMVRPILTNKHHEPEVINMK